MMPVSGKDIEIFILTYNRSQLLRATLENILKQTVSDIKITVLDNASTDDTESMIQPFVNLGIKYSKENINLGVDGNILKAQRLANRAWVMMFHDDDFMHPDFFKIIIEQLNIRSDIVLLGSSMSFDKNPSDKNWSKIRIPKIKFCSNHLDFATELYNGFNFNFGSAVYKGTVFKVIKWENEKYGKIADRPFLIEAAKHGSTILINEPLIQYRLHENQGSDTPETGPFPDQLSSLHACYKTIIGENFFNSKGLVFLKNNFSYLNNEFSHVAKLGTFKSRYEYFNYVVKYNGSSWKALFIGAFYYGIKFILNYCLQFLYLIKKKIAR